MQTSKKATKAKKIVKKQMKKAGVAKGSPGRSYLAQLSPYLCTIADPVNNWGCKIPDSVTTPSFVVHLRMRFQQAATAGAGANPAAGFFRVLGATVQAADNSNCTLTNGATSDALSATPQVNPWAAALAGVASAHRVISAELYGSYQGATQTDGGRWMATFYPPYNQLTLPPASIASTVLSAPLTQTSPVKSGFCQVRYVPVDPIALAYTKTSATSAASSDIRVGQLTYGAFSIVADGMTSGQVVEFTCFENYECLPIQSALSLASPTVSKSDPIELAYAANTLAANPTFAVAQSPEARLVGTGVVSQPLIAAKPTQGESGSFFDKVLSSIEKTIPVAEKVVGFAAPLLAGLL